MISQIDGCRTSAGNPWMSRTQFWIFATLLLKLRAPMTLNELKRLLAAAVSAARAAGDVMRRNWRAPKKVNEETSHDIKLELDVRCQKLIERKLRRAYPNIALLGEEGVAGDANAACRWVVDPIDGTVNFAHDIPHASVSIALQEFAGKSADGDYTDGYNSMLGVVYDPFTNELWTAIRGQPARLNGKPIRVSERRELGRCIASIGFAKSRANLERSLPYLLWLTRRVRKIRMMGSAALALTYVASGRFDAYIERGISLWDVAAGGLIVQCAGGRFHVLPAPGPHRYRMISSNARLFDKLPAPK